MSQFFSELGQKDRAYDLSGVIRVRIDADVVAALDRIEGYARGRGHRDITRSALIRAAVASFVENIAEELPEEAR